MKILNSGRVTGGQLANLGQFPYQTLIFMLEQSGRTFLCGGSLLTSTAILTVIFFLCSHFEGRKTEKIFFVYILKFRGAEN